jgi:hypothetical protein
LSNISGVVTTTTTTINTTTTITNTSTNNYNNNRNNKSIKFIYEEKQWKITSKNLTNVRKQKAVFVKYVYDQTDCTGNRNTS